MKRTLADSRWSKAVRERDGYRCRRCGKQHATNSTGLHAAHIFSRGILRTRHDVINGLAMCWGCHVVFDHMEKSERENFARLMIGDEEYDALKERARNPRKRQPVCQGEERERGCVS